MSISAVIAALCDKNSLPGVIARRNGIHKKGNKSDMSLILEYTGDGSNCLNAEQDEKKLDWVIVPQKVRSS
jgi:hypothetical protein